MDRTVGVPLITPFESMVMPFGSAGETVQLTIVPPLEVGVAEVIAESLVSTKVLGL